VLRAMAAVLDGSASPSTGSDPRPTTLVVMTSEQPLCGAFNPTVLEFAELRWKALREAGDAHLVVVGQRGIRQLIARGLDLAAGEPAATSLEGLHDLVKRLSDLLGRRHSSGDLGTLLVAFNRYQSLSEQVPTEVRILPPDLDLIRRSAPARESRYHHYLTSTQLLT